MLGATFAPPVILVLVALLAGTVGLFEASILRRAGAVAIGEAIVVVLGLAALVYLRILGDRGAAHAAAAGLPVWLVLAIGATWAADVGAYVVGSRFGRRRIVPRISPRKTWEGTVGGFAAASLAVLGIAALFGLGRPEAAVAAVAIGPVAFAGDLLESYLKRRAGVKDSGTLLPGHGGMLDRIDSLVAVAPFVAGLTLAAGLG